MAKTETAPKIEAKIVKKLSMKVLLGGRPKIPENDTPVYLAKVIGIASGIQSGESNYGTWRALVGQFIAEAYSVENPGSVVRFRTGKAFLPDVALDLIAPAVMNAGKGEQIQFAFDIGVQKDDSSATGYVYVAKSLIEPEENDPLEMLSAKALGNAPALENKTK